MGEVMAGNANLNAAKKAKNDEFYTLYADIEKEMQAYYEYNPDFLKDKVLLLPCDDHSKSNFVKYFVDNFEKFQLKELVSSCYVENGKGKVLHKTREGEQTYLLKGNGDFRSGEVTVLRDKADAVITNPPFSLFRAFFDWVSEKEFSIVGNLNSVTYKEVFPLIKSGGCWVGVHTGRQFGGFFFPCSSEDLSQGLELREREGRLVAGVNNCLWLTTYQHKKRSEKIKMIKSGEKVRLNDKQERVYLKEYSTSNAVEIPKVEAIPQEYKGVMGVPISFLFKHNPDQFLIIGCDNSPKVNGEKIYKRILIKAMS